MSMVDDIIPEGAEPEEEQTDVEAPSEAPLASQEPEAAEAEAVEAVEAEEQPAQPDPWAAYRADPRFASYIDEAGGDPGKILERLHGLRQQLSRGQEPEPQAEPEPQPLSSAPLGAWPPETVEELYQMAQHDPATAAQWAIANKHIVPQNALQDVCNNWYFANPMQATAYAVQQMEVEREHRFRQQIEPIQQHTAKTVSDAAQALAQQQIGADWEPYKGRIAELCQDEAYAKFFFRHGETPEGLAQGIVDAWAWLKKEEWMHQRRGQAPAASQQTPAQPAQEADERPRDEHGRFAATTTGRGSAPSRTPTTNEELADAIIGV